MGRARRPRSHGTRLRRGHDEPSPRTSRSRRRSRAVPSPRTSRSARELPLVPCHGYGDRGWCPSPWFDPRAGPGNNRCGARSSRAALYALRVTVFSPFASLVSQVFVPLGTARVRDVSARDARTRARARAHARAGERADGRTGGRRADERTDGRARARAHARATDRPLRPRSRG